MVQHNDIISPGSLCYTLPFIFGWSFFSLFASLHTFFYNNNRCREYYTHSHRRQRRYLHIFIYRLEKWELGLSGTCRVKWQRERHFLFKDSIFFNVTHIFHPHLLSMLPNRLANVVQGKHHYLFVFLAHFLLLICLHTLFKMC